MKKWQKVLPCLLVLVIGFSTLATSCGGNKDEEQSESDEPGSLRESK